MNMADYGFDNLVDIHTHVIPGVDDGPRTLEDAARLLTALRASGVNRVFCTSHFKSPHFDTPLEDLQAQFQLLCAARAKLPEPGAWPELVFGAEVRISPAIEPELRACAVPRLGETDYVLAEYPSRDIKVSDFQLQYELRVRGYKTILAHPERNLLLLRCPELVEDLMENGMLMQVTAESLLGDERKGDPPTRFAWEIVRKGQAALIASDAHDPEHRRPVLRQAYERIADRLGEAVALAFIENANAVWENRTCRPVPPSLPKHRFILIPPRQRPH